MADISRRHHWFSSEMTSEKRALKCHTDDVSLVVLSAIDDSDDDDDDNEEEEEDGNASEGDGNGEDD